MFWSTFTCFFFLIFFFFTLSARVFSYSCSFSPFHLFFLLVAPGPAAINLLMMQQHTYYLLSFVQFCTHTFFTLLHSIVSLTLTFIAPYSLFSLALSPHTRRSIFYMCVCSLFSSFLLCVSSFIDYLNVTTKLDISTSSNKLGFCFFLMCVFPFILNISLLFFKRLKLRIFYPSFDRALLFPSSSLRCFFWHKIIFCNFHCFFFGIKALHYFLLAVTISTFFLFSIRIITQNTRARSLIDLHCFVECVCVFLCVCEWVCKTMTKVIAYVFVCVFVYLVYHFL